MGVFIRVIVVFCLLAQFVRPVLAEGSRFAGGDGSSANPYQIETVEQLKAMAQEPLKSYILMNHLDLQSVGAWQPIPLFKGTFNGNGYTISNLQVSGGISPSNIEGTGLFSVLAGRVKQLKLTNATVTAASPIPYVGVLAGKLEYAELNEVSVEGTVRTNNVQVTGGLVGLSVESRIKDSVAHVKITSSGGAVGGLVGHLSAGNVATSYANSSLTFMNARKSGCLIGDRVNATIDKSYYVKEMCSDSNSAEGKTLNDLFMATDGWEERIWFKPWRDYPEPRIFRPHLQSLSLQEGAINEPFSYNRFTYTASVPSDTSAVHVQASAKHSSDIKVEGADSLTGVTNEVTVTVGTGERAQTYTIIVERKKSSVATLKEVKVTSSAGSETVPITGTKQVIPVASTVSEVTLDAVATNERATVTINGDKGTKIPLVEGSNEVAIEVVAEDGVTKQSYVIDLQRAPKSSDATLQQLTIDGQPLDATVATQRYEVDNKTTAVKVAATPTHAEAKAVVVSGDALVVGDNRVVVTVTAENGAVKTYTIIVERRAPLSADTTLKQLDVANGSFTPAFVSGQRSYVVTVPYTVDKASVTAVPSAKGASYKVIGPATLVEGDNAFIVRVTAANGTTGDYELTIKRLAKPLVKAIKGQGWSLSPAFQPDVLQYKVTVDSDTLSLPLVVIVYDGADATVTAPKVLAVGNNVMTVRAFSEDGKREQLYTITVVRQAPSVVVVPTVPPVIIPEQPIKTVVREEGGVRIVDMNVSDVTSFIKQGVATVPVQATANKAAVKVEPTALLTLQKQGVALQLQSPKGTLQVPAEVLNRYSTGVQATFQFAPTVAKELATATLLSQPVDISFAASSPVVVKLPLTVQPKGKTVRIFAQHSQGDTEWLTGEVVGNEVVFTTSRFSTFTAVEMAPVTATVNGKATVGSTLTAQLSEAVPGATYQWYRGTEVVGTKASYVIVANDSAQPLKVVITLPDGRALTVDVGVVSCATDSRLGCVVTTKDVVVYTLVNGKLVATAKTVDANRELAMVAKLPAAYVVAKDGRWLEKKGVERYEVPSKALLQQVKAGKKVVWHGQSLLPGQIGRVITSETAPLWLNGERIGTAKRNVAERVYAVRSALYQVGEKQFVLASAVQWIRGR